MKYVIAVSGGVDSMVLLDMMTRAGVNELVVAHFDHGIRPNSHLDAALVESTAKRHGLVFEKRREELGPNASEALARERRYAFLHEVAKKHDARIITAHHLDDLAETIAINLTRGTGWRGLAALDADITRPLIDMEKSLLIEYAEKRNLLWREDPTNASDAYLRNRVRRKAVDLESDVKRQLRALHAHQKALKQEIRKEALLLTGKGPKYDRYFFIHVPVAVALECLREVTEGKLTRPQLARVLHAIKVAKPNTTFEAGLGIRLNFSTRQFSF